MSDSRTSDEMSDNSDRKTNLKTSLDQIEDQSLDGSCYSTKCSAASASCSDEETSENSLWQIWQCENQMNWDNFNGSDCMDESNGEGLSFSSAPELFQSNKVSSQDEDYGTESIKNNKPGSSVEDEEYEELKQFRRESDRRRETSSLEGISELIRKFSTIELLRRKENLKKCEEADSNESPSCSSNSRQHASANQWNPEDFLENGEFKIPDQKHDWKNIDCDEESDSDGEDEKMKDMKLIKRLLSHALGNDKQQGKRRSDEILTASYIESKTENEDDDNDLCETEIVYEEDAYSSTVPTSPKTEAESSLDHSEIFDGFEIDCPDSFQDWMLDSILSKDINSSTDLEERNYFL